MVKRLTKIVFSFLLALSVLNAGFASAAVKPTDVRDYVPVAVNYAAGTTANVLGDGSATAGTPPAAAYALPDIPTVESGWLIAGSTQPLTTANGGSAPEKKMRSLLSGTVKILFDDPIRNFAAPGTSHCHEIFNNLSVNAYSTFSTLRTKARQFSLGGGGPLNGTGYWFPCPVDANGKVVRPVGSIILYYVADPFDIITPLYLGLRYVGGTNMDDPNETWLQARLDVANAQPGTAGRYQLVDGSGNHGYTLRWTCQHVATQYTARWLKNGDGSDPFGGNCLSGDDLWMQFVGPDCWDGTNYWSDGGNVGYRNVIPKVWDTVKSKWVCPNGWYQVPALTLQIHFAQTGFSDYGTWRLSSDDMEQAKLTALGTPRAINNGESFHSDWFNGWDGATLTAWLTKCLAAAILSGADPHQCDSSDLGNMTALITAAAAPTGRSPQVQGGPGDHVTVATQHNGPVTIHTHGAMNDNMPMPANDNQTQLAGVVPLNFSLGRPGR